MVRTRTVKGLVAEVCANFSGPDRCLPADAPCRYFAPPEGRLPRCRWFEQAVLPLDPQLEKLYWAERKADAEGRQLSRREREAALAITVLRGQCERCGTAFDRRSNRQRYCPACMKAAAREAARQRKRRQREGAA
ncbi:cysteine-rich VLP domain-containing protein [Caldinitratiruptor microaerophilus]|uniref:Cysteine-rich VLP domain-containing protein n=1 Tax=Caldinitratiruptor microaerophilus TaxID=671077 RepID=A0AA35G944_9FIRM|nr:cysteine-rich VLP domain-containing protein [Caldinitratiruptor microaerophilus]BDG59914.1 hypothetical protein caldi_10040 [Caldinitratiruptor microaerophilus]